MQANFMAPSYSNSHLDQGDQEKSGGSIADPKNRPFQPDGDSDVKDPDRPF